jgi:hypothetical protein
MTNIDLDKGGRIPQVVNTWCGPTKGWVKTDSPVDIEYVSDGGGQVVTPGYKGGLIVPDWLVVHDWVVLADNLGSIVVDIWKIPLSTYLAGTLPNVGNTITGTDLPRLVGQLAATSELLTGWTTQLDQNDFIAFNVNSATSIVRANVTLRCVRIIGQS